MLRTKYIDKLIIILVLAALAASTFLLIKSEEPVDAEYAVRLFNDEVVHEINLIIDDPQTFFDNVEDEEYIMADIEIDGERIEAIGLRAKGNNSLHLTHDYNLIRYSFKIEFDHFISGQNYYGLDKMSLDASFQDNSYLKTKLTYDMFASMGVPVPLTSFAFIKINGQDFGLYLALEEMEESFLRRNFGNNYGSLYKPDYRNLNDENADIALIYKGDDSDLYPGIFDNAKTIINDADKKRIVKAIKVLNSQENIDDYFDIEEILNYFVVQVFVLNWDSYIGHTGHNYYLYEEDGKIQILPWDYNLAYGTYALGMSEPLKDAQILINFPIDTPCFGEIMTKRPLYHLLMQNDDIFNRYHELFQTFIDNFYTNKKYTVLIRQYYNLIAPYIKKDPSSFCSFEDFQKAINSLEKWCSLRFESIILQLEGRAPSTLAELYQDEAKLLPVDIKIEDFGDFDDLEWSLNNSEKLRANLGIN